ncbi:unnamed protein product [Symbiodinium sp. CCMP2456]|nr:unnamed protein product [Symbiodinium sp. CCMP2456]
MRSSGASQCRRLLGIGHNALLSLDGQYRQRIAARDAALNYAKVPPLQVVDNMLPRRRLRRVDPQLRQQVVDKQAAAKKSAQPVVVKRPPVIPQVDPLAAVFTEPFVDSVAADVDLMVYRTEPPKEEPQVQAAPPRPDVGNMDYLDMIAPDLEFHMQAAPASQPGLPPVPGSSLASSEDGDANNDQLIDLDTDSEEDPMDDPAEQDQGDDDDDDDQGPPRIVQRSVLCTAPVAPPWDSGAAASSAATVGDTEQGQQDAAGYAATTGDTTGVQTAPVQDPPVAPAPQTSWPPPDLVAREARRAARRQREVDAEARWADEPDPCNVLPNETSTIWSLPQGVPEQPVPSRYADSRVHGFCNLGCETPKRHRTDVCLGHAEISVRVPHVFVIFLASRSAGVKDRPSEVIPRSPPLPTHRS